MKRQKLNLDSEEIGKFAEKIENHILGMKFQVIISPFVWLSSWPNVSSFTLSFVLALLFRKKNCKSVAIFSFIFFL